MSNMVMEHDCKLNYQDDGRILNQVIETGLFIDLRRWLHGICLVSINHPITAVYYKSTTARAREEIRHLANYRWMIHPFSMLALYWEFFIHIIFIMQLATMSIVASYNVDFRKLSPIVIWTITLDYVMTIDMVKIFVTGYYDHIQNRTILQPGRIAKKYFKTYFVIDFLACVHSYYVPIRFIFKANSQFQEKTFVLMFVLKYLTGLRIIRVGRWLEALELYRLYMNHSSVLNRTIRAVLLFVILMFFMFNMLFHVKEVIELNAIGRDREFEKKNIVRNLFSATLMLLHINFGNSTATDPVRIVVTLIYMAMGYCLQLLLFTLVLQVWIKFSNARSKNESLFQQFSEYLKYKDLPISLRKKFFSFYQFKFQNQFYNEAHINKIISKILRQEILVYVTKNHVQRVEFFQDMPDYVLTKIVSKLKSEIYLANDVIIKAGVAGKCMFFIYFGTVAIYTYAGREICHLEDGAHFGEIALIYNEPRVATVVAVTPCELFVLNRSDFLEVLEPFPEIQDKIVKLAEERLRTTSIKE